MRNLTATITVAILSVFCCFGSVVSAQPTTMKMSLTIAQAPTLQVVSNKPVTISDIYAKAKRNQKQLQFAGNKAVDCKGLPKSVILNRVAEYPYWKVWGCISKKAEITMQPEIQPNGDVVFGLKWDELHHKNSSYSKIENDVIFHFNLPATIQMSKVNSRFIVYIDEMP